MLHKVQRRGGFSDRNGIDVLNTEMQYHNFDERTRNIFINWIIKWYNNLFGDNLFDLFESQELFRFIISDVYGETVSSGQIQEKYFWNMVKNTIWTDKYHAVLTLMEAFADFYSEKCGTKVYDDLNELFEEEYVGYRVIAEEITPITDENEIESINEVCSNPYENVSGHIRKAVVLLSDRETPDYENSIKESISAVEAMCSMLLGKKDTLGAALKKLENEGIYIHPSMKSAFEKLYGYTSDAQGIRHAGELGGQAATFEEAKFMLVTCSAFINYLKGVLK